MGRGRTHQNGTFNLHIQYPAEYRDIFDKLKLFAIENEKPIWRILVEILESFFDTHVSPQPPSREENNIAELAKVTLLRQIIQIRHSSFMNNCDKLVKLISHRTPDSDATIYHILQEIYSDRKEVLKSIASLPQKYVDADIKKIFTDVLELSPLGHEGRRLYEKWLYGKL